MRNAGFQLVADLHDKDSALELCDLVFPLLRGAVRIHIFELLRGDEEDIFRKDFLNIIILDGHVFLCFFQSLVHFLNHLFQSVHVAVFFGDDFLPVPLVHIDGMDVVCLLIPADGVHIGIKTLAVGKTVFFQSVPFPFCKRMDDLGIFALYAADIEAYRALHAVQVIVQTRGRLNEKGSGHTQKVQPLGEGALEEIFDGLDGNLGIVKIQIGMVIFRINGFAHKNPSFVFFSKAKRQQMSILCRFEPLQYMLAYQEKGVNWKFQKIRAVFGKGSAIIKILSFAWENEKMKRKHSLKLVIVSLAFLCWLIPILLMVAVMGYYVLSKQDDEQLERLAEQMAASSRICQERLDGAIANSRRISYDKTVQQKYEQYQRGELSYAALYSEVQYYLSVEYSRKKEAAFALIMMNGKEKDESFNVVNSSAGGSYQGILEFWEQDAELVKECAAKLDTAIGFVRNQGRLKYQFDHIYEEELALEDARIMALQSHINPHFMNNTLEIINWEARLAGNDKVSEMISSLGTLLDAALDRKKQPEVPLKEELTYVKAYLFIMKERFGKRLEVTLEIPEELYQEKVPRLILQPVIENAIAHGVQVQGTGKVRITGKNM